MIHIYKAIRGGLVEQKNFAKDSWINLESPTEEELQHLKEKVVGDVGEFDGFITSLKDPDEQARVETEGTTLFVVIRVPYTVKTEDEEIYTTRPLGLIRLDDYLITISYFDTGVLEALPDQRIEPHRKIETILKIFILTARRYLSQLRQINQKTFTLQDKLEKSTRNEDLIRLLSLEKSLVYFSTSLHTNNYIINKLTFMHVFNKYEEDKELLEDILIEFKQATEMTDTYSKILDSMRHGFESVISNNLNKAIKTLTSITLLFMMPTLIASIYGMNIDLPFQRSTYAFLFVMLITVLSAILTVGYLWKKDWF